MISARDMDSDGSIDLTMVATTAAVAANRKEPFGQEQREGEKVNGKQDSFSLDISGIFAEEPCGAHGSSLNGKMICLGAEMR